MTGTFINWRFPVLLYGASKNLHCYFSWKWGEYDEWKPPLSPGQPPQISLREECVVVPGGYIPVVL